MSFFQSDQFLIYYEITEPLFPKPTVLLHGNMASRRWWGPLLQRAESAKKNSHQSSKLFPAILVDFPGCGLSAIPKTPEWIDVRAYSLGFLELVLSLESRWSNEPFCLVGHSTGGLIANLMMAHANQVLHRESLFYGAVMVNAVGPQGLKRVSLLDKMKDLSRDSQQLFLMMTTTLNYREEFQDFVESVAVPEAHIALDQIQGRLLESMMQKDFSEDFQQVSQKELVLFGEKDLVLPKQHAEKICEIIPQARLVFIPEVGHSLNVENPQELFRQIFEFCSSGKPD